MKLEQKKDAFLEDIKDFPSWAEVLKVNHWSPTQLNSMICLWAYKYLYLTQQERRELPGSAKMFAGTALGEMLKLTFGDYEWISIKGKGLQKIKVKKVKDVLKTILEKGNLPNLKPFNDYKPEHDLDKQDYEMTRNGLAASYDTLKSAMKDVALTGDVECERSVLLNLKNAELPVIGRIDAENSKAFIEFKTKHKKRNKPKKDGTTSYSLPNINQGYFGWNDHILQVATYYFANEGKKKPHLVVINESKYNIFTPDNCEDLKPENLKIHINKMDRIACERESIMSKHAGKHTWVQEISPDFTHFFWKNMGEHLAKAKNLWKENL